MECGKHSAYQRVLDRRLKPLSERWDRQPLKRAIFVTQWWDGCSPPGAMAFNLPSPAWTGSHFLADRWTRGIAPHNRNDITRRANRLFPNSILIQDRGVQRVAWTLWRTRRPQYECPLARTPSSTHSSKTLWPAEFDTRAKSSFLVRGC